MDSLSLIGLTGVEIVRRALVRNAVQFIFGYPGGAALPLFDGILKGNTDFRFILSHHEQGAGHMAQGYARASQRTGVVLVTSGPGSSNMVTPMLDALLDGTPMVVLCAQVPTNMQGKAAFQEIDILAVSKSCVKWNALVRDVTDLERCLEIAFHQAKSGRPGPVLLAISKDVATAKLTPGRISPRQLPTLYSHPLPLPAATAAAPDLLPVANLINHSERPVICAGQGLFTCPRGPEYLEQLSQKARIPVATTLLGLGCFDEEKEEALHMFGTYGFVYANFAIQNADLVLVLGARLDDRAVGDPTSFASTAKQAGGLIQIDLVPENINKVVLVSRGLCANLADVLPRLLSLIDCPHDNRAAWFTQIRHWKQLYPFDSCPRSIASDGIMPQAVIDVLRRETRPSTRDTIITTGVGQHQMWAARLYRWHASRTLITSGAMATMGFGLPAAIGAKLARPDAQVIDIDGDASFCMTMEELLTARQYNIPVKVVILNNNGPRMIFQSQQDYYGRRHVTPQQLNPDFVRLAESMGCPGRRCSDASQLGHDIRWLLDKRDPALLEVCTAQDVPIYPIVMRSAPLDQITFNSRSRARVAKL